MPGTARSGRNKDRKSVTKPDGAPQPPWPLSESAAKHFAWLLERLGAVDGSVWRRIDGATVAAVAELFESAEQLSKSLASAPADDKLLRLRVQYADRIYKFSSILGLTPRDRERLPQNEKTEDDDPDEWSDAE